jgi:hypothetical protein
MRFQEGPEREINFVFALSNEDNAIFQVSTNDQYTTSVLPLLPVGTYQGLVAHMGCPVLEDDGCQLTGIVAAPAGGWVAMIPEGEIGGRCVL